MAGKIINERAVSNNNINNEYKDRSNQYYSQNSSNKHTASCLGMHVLSEVVAVILILTD
jgi:hypothetical protein